MAVGEAEAVVLVFAAAPAADVNAVALVYQKGGGREVDVGQAEAGAAVVAGPAAKHGAKPQRVEAGAEFLDVLGAAGVGVAAGAGDEGCQRLAQQINLALGVELHEISLVVGGAAQVAGPADLAAVGADAGHKGIDVAPPGGLQTPGRDRKIRARGAARGVHATGRIELQRVGGIGPAAAQQATEAQCPEARREAAHHAVGGAAVVGAAEAAGGAGEVGRAGTRGQVHIVLGIEQHVAPEVVAVVVAEAGGGVLHTQQAVGVGAAEVGGGQQRIAAGREPADDQIGAVGQVVGRAKHEGRRPARHQRRRAVGRHQRPAIEAAVKRPRRGRKIGARRGAHYHQFAPAIGDERVRKLRGVAAQVRGPHPRRRAAGAGVVLDEGNVAIQAAAELVHHAVEDGAVGPDGGRVARPKHDAAGVQVALLVVGGREAPVVGRRAGEGGKDDRRVDGQRPAGVVGPEGEADFGLALGLAQHEAAAHGAAAAGGIGLPGRRGQFGEAAQGQG